MTSPETRRKCFPVAAVLLLLVVSNLITFWLTSRHAPQSTGDQINPAISTRYVAKLNKLRRPPSIGSSFNEIGSPKPKERQLEARSYFFDPQHADQPPKLAVLNSTGRVTTGAAEAVGLSPEERIGVQKAFNAVFAKAESDFVSRAVYDESASKPDSGIYVFDVPATQDRGASLLLELHDQLEQLLGSSRAETLCRALDPEQLRGGLGRSDMRCELYTPKSKIGGGETVVHYQLANPETGTVHTKAETTLETFKERFGDVFSFQPSD